MKLSTFPAAAYGRFHISFGCPSREPDMRGSLQSLRELAEGHTGPPVWKAFLCQTGFGDLEKDPKTWFLRLGSLPTWREEERRNGGQ